MGWEQRGNHRYFYWSFRIGRRVHKAYSGRGEMVELTARFLAREHERRESVLAQVRSEKQAAENVDQAVGRFECVLDDELRRQLEEAGYRQHKRGEWRRRRVRKT